MIARGTITLQAGDIYGGNITHPYSPSIDTKRHYVSSRGSDCLMQSADIL